MTDWRKKAEEFALAQRRMKLSGEIQLAALSLGAVLYELARNGEKPELMAELGRMFEAFHTRLGAST